MATIHIPNDVQNAVNTLREFKDKSDSKMRSAGHRRGYMDSEKNQRERVSYYRQQQAIVRAELAYAVLA